ncbi:hypothetical protein [Senegalia sp. (in: firmicutes)]|uniref:hypothetical protein n=1 Tax=Senegalia sp. (in: firmicutes) TaxID=1924098 RepID=UPI003F9E0EBE
MNTNIKYKKELYFSLNNYEQDIIRKDIYEFNKLISILNNIPPLYIEKDKYFNTLYKQRDISKLLQLVCSEYLKNINKNFEIDKESIYLTIKLINKFYDIFKPININEKYLIIYPRLSIKKYITNIIESENFTTSYIPEDTLNKLIILLIKFSEFELNNIDEENFENINLPTLVLANLKLFEKGILTISKNINNEIEFYINKSIKDNKSMKIIMDEEMIIYKIIQLLFEKKYGLYKINDFMK